MKIELENIGMLKKASVKINGLTVIAGENDTGKSTVGKIIFCIIKAISRYEEDFQESREFKIQEILDRIFFFLRKNLDLLSDEKKYQEILNSLSIERINTQFKTDDYFIELKDKIKNVIYPQNYEEKLIDSLIKDLESIIQSPEDKQKSIENALNKVFRSEFNSNILYYPESIGYIKLYENDLLLLDIEINNDNKVILKNKVQPIEIEEATFIETPLILNNYDLLIRSQTGLDITKRSSRRLGVPYTTLHTKDLFDKLKAREFTLYFDDDFELKVQKNIMDTIKGEVIYDEDEKDFVYKKGEHKISIKNTATGIKAFGIMQLLIDNGFINRKSILILDEPEIHLHPKWQLTYAQIIVMLAKNEIPILVTSHSPYMIEALKRFSDKEEIAEYTNFYLSTENVIEDENNLESIFEKLSEPFEVFMQMDEEILHD
ncbi:AAA family ATPase [Aliarcobacter butzleri]|uniref:AAA family ATPase n=1 Tax=Aliarcobacter butzleri TaxID=28197 RepID=UPI00263DE696|nr:AAA family ATPase [Aliarcobacter butzleri]MDN5072353.1 AAA family ATPase [Aliarcobacter butzleri]MDN5121207.1 AAA family ATPase [Aliarcobacter butzleri]